MAFTNFAITGIDTNLMSKTVTIGATYDFDPNTINDSSITLLDKQTKNLTEYELKLSGKQITLTLKDWPAPNKEYILSIQKLKSVVGDELSTTLRRRIFFNSDIVSTINITKPADNEYLKEPILEWEEINQEKLEPVNSYYIEIAEDQAFYKIVKSTLVENRTNIELSKIEKGQYFVRCRAQKDNQYGIWSETKTFVIDSINKSPDPIIEEDEEEFDLTPIIEEELEILTAPEDNETPQSIIIEFNDEIDKDSIQDLIIMRRSI